MRYRHAEFIANPLLDDSYRQLVLLNMNKLLLLSILVARCLVPSGQFSCYDVPRHMK